jgi:hypothetical protein
MGGWRRDAAGAFIAQRGLRANGHQVKAGSASAYRPPVVAHGILLQPRRLRPTAVRHIFPLAIAQRGEPTSATRIRP